MLAYAIYNTNYLVFVYYFAYFKQPGSKLATVDMDGIYLLILTVKNADNLDQALFNITGNCF